MQDFNFKTSSEPNIKQSSEFKKCGWLSLLNPNLSAQINHGPVFYLELVQFASNLYFTQKNSVVIYLFH